MASQQVNNIVRKCRARDVKYKEYAHIRGPVNDERITLAHVPGVKRTEVRRILTGQPGLEQSGEPRWRRPQTPPTNGHLIKVVSFSHPSPSTTMTDTVPENTRTPEAVLKRVTNTLLRETTCTQPGLLPCSSG